MAPAFALSGRRLKTPGPDGLRRRSARSRRASAGLDGPFHCLDGLPGSIDAPLQCLREAALRRLDPPPPAQTLAVEVEFQLPGVGGQARLAAHPLAAAAPGLQDGRLQLLDGPPPLDGPCGEAVPLLPVLDA